MQIIFTGNSPRRSIAGLLVLVAILTFTSNAFAAVETKVVTGSELWPLFAKRAYPIYPYEARRAYMSGAGLYRMYIEPDGTVRTVGVMKSTGSKILDLAAAGALYQWKAKPYPRRREIDMPVAFHLGPRPRRR